ncbi:MAG TPA: hypothetical protein VLZ81_18205 [Blastocatellia bacterium]|nr:hypothetical protein [Blastocatellia bacterium]
MESDIEFSSFGTRAIRHVAHFAPATPTTVTKPRNVYSNQVLLTNGTIANG